MMLRSLRYNLVRYVPDSERMEPTNVGIILQGDGRVSLKLNPDTARRSDVETDEFRKWKLFLQKEIDSESVPLFQPDRTSEAYLNYLERLCTGPVFLSRPLIVQVPEHQTFDLLLLNLYQRLVAPPTSRLQEASTRPTGAFRQWSEERRFAERGMRRHAHVVVKDHRLWMAYRQVLNGEAIALDKVEVQNRLGETSNEIERLPLIAGRLEEFLNGRVDGKRTRYFLLADELKVPFGDQSEAEFTLMKADLEERVSSIERKGGTVLRSTSEVRELVEKLDKALPEPQQR